MEAFGSPWHRVESGPEICSLQAVEQNLDWVVSLGEGLQLPAAAARFRFFASCSKGHLHGFCLVS